MSRRASGRPWSWLWLVVLSCGCVGTVGVSGGSSDSNGSGGSGGAARSGDSGGSAPRGSGGSAGGGAAGGNPGSTDPGSGGSSETNGSNGNGGRDGGSAVADGGVDARVGGGDARDVTPPRDVVTPIDASTSDVVVRTDAAGDRTTDAGSSTVWRPFNDVSPWNTRIAANATVDPGSATMIADFSSVPGQTTFWVNIQDFSIPVYFVDSTVTAAVGVMANLGGIGFRTGAPNEGDVAGSGTAPIPTSAMAAAGTDRHLAVVDRSTRMEWGFFNAARSGADWRVSLAATQDLAGTGVRPPERNSPWWAGHGPRACGFGLIAGLITVDEMKAGRIDHALVIAYPHMRSRYYTPPASTAQGTTGDAQPTRGILCGGRIQLDPALDLTTLALPASGLVIARALQEYGAIVGDFSGAMSLYADSSPEAQAYWTGGVLSNNSAGRIPLNRFRVLTIGTTYDNMN